MQTSERYDVVICGGGLAGLSLCRQLKRAMPDLSIAVFERTHGNIPDAAYKVGESSVEGGAYYYTEVLGLAGYFNKQQLHKLGLRFFFGDSQGPVEDRPELGARRFARVPSYQIDRGVFERDLRRMAREIGVELFEEAKVTDIDVAEGQEDHVVKVVLAGETEERSVKARFVADASGRRRLLQRKLGLGLPSPHRINAAWWRVKGEYDIEKMAAAKNPTWSPKTQERKWFSTNHLMGRGYWVWMIPLSSGNTSIGIVADESIHPFETHATEAKARAWIQKHEPALAEFTKDAEWLDFLKFQNCSLFSKQIFSHNRWSCVGETGIFLDAFYSPGNDYIAYTNTITTRMVELDRMGKLNEQVADTFNRLMLEDIWPNYLAMYLDNYQCFGSAPVMFTKIMWDTCFYWAMPSQLLFRGLIGNEIAARDFHPIAARFHRIQQRMQKCFRDWTPKAVEPSKYMFVEYSKMPLCAELHLDLLKDKTPEQCFRDMRRNVDRLEAWCASLEREVYGRPQTVPPAMDEEPAFAAESA